MEKKGRHLGLIIDAELHHKLHYIAKYEGRSANGQILYLLRQYILNFEKEHGDIIVPEEKRPVCN